MPFSLFGTKHYAYSFYWCFVIPGAATADNIQVLGLGLDEIPS
jgi:hypothetical protein